MQRKFNIVYEERGPAATVRDLQAAVAAAGGAWVYDGKPGLAKDSVKRWRDAYKAGKFNDIDGVASSSRNNMSSMRLPGGGRPALCGETADAVKKWVLQVREADKPKSVRCLHPSARARTHTHTHTLTHACARGMRRYSAALSC